KLRGLALKEEIKSVSGHCQTTMTLLDLMTSLSSMFSMAEHLAQVVHETVRNAYIDSEILVPASKMTVRILDTLYQKLNEVCLVQVDEVFFYANKAITIDQPTFWETSYLFRPVLWMNSKSNEILTSGGESTQVGRQLAGLESASFINSGGDKDHSDIECPIFLKELARPIVSSGKSLQLVRYVWNDYLALHERCHGAEFYVIPSNFSDSLSSWFQNDRQSTLKAHKIDGSSNSDSINGESNNPHNARILGILTLSEIFLISLVGIVGDGEHIYGQLAKPFSERTKMSVPCCEQKTLKNVGDGQQTSLGYKKFWVKFLFCAIAGKSNSASGREILDALSDNCICTTEDDCQIDSEVNIKQCQDSSMFTVPQPFIQKRLYSWTDFNVCQYAHLPPLDDESMRNAIYSEKFIGGDESFDIRNEGSLPRVCGTDYTFGFLCELKQLDSSDGTGTLESLYSFPTRLPCFEEDAEVSDFLPFQKNSTLSMRILSCIKGISLDAAPHVGIIVKECLGVYIKKQMDEVGRITLLKLMTDWRLMDELNVLRSIYLLGSGDLLQRFLTVIFDKIDKGETWNDDFELNTILQESIRNSADRTLLSAPDSLVVSIAQPDTLEDEESKASNIMAAHGDRVCGRFFGIDALDLLKFSYKVSWPLNLIVNAEALKKYNQVMCFLLKVKRAKFLLDKARRWMWKVRSSGQNHKHHLSVEQKLLHFVDAFHQYVMERVFYSAWIELCTAMSSAGSLDEVIEVHEAYLLLVQRQCFVGTDKLWALIASRVKSILSLALDFYSIQQTLHCGGAALAIKARCEMEVDRIEKQFDDCIAFLIRILSFKFNVGHSPPPG
ncbi:hypothetical protein HPP92_010073, partial [Vanilla planifolia]